mmetsp:Transcript_10155/g.23932  ORF Transcript_10155/g.23932 Transcript_10155/m.23932 type:complete len:94 (-) Transcript_10155:14-295(-)
MPCRAAGDNSPSPPRRRRSGRGGSEKMSRPIEAERWSLDAERLRREQRWGWIASLEAAISVRQRAPVVAVSCPARVFLSCKRTGGAEPLLDSS